MTHGKYANRGYVVLDRPDDHPDDRLDPTGRGDFQHDGAELSAHETITSEQKYWGSITPLATEYETIAAAAPHDRWATLIRPSGLTSEQADFVIDGVLCTPS